MEEYKQRLIEFDREYTDIMKSVKSCMTAEEEVEMQKLVTKTMSYQEYDEMLTKLRKDAREEVEQLLKL